MLQSQRLPKPIRRVARWIVDAVEIHIPTVVFTVLFVVFLLQIISRYFFRPLTWPEELALIAFIWTALLGGLYAKRDDKHVVFTVIYDSVSPKVQRWMRLVGNTLLIAAFIIALAPSWDYVTFMAFKKSNVLRIPMHIAFFPFIVFLVFMIGRLLADIVKDVRELFTSKKGGAT